MNKEEIQTLLIEDNPGDARLIQEFLKDSKKVDFSIKIHETLSEGLEEFLNNKFDIVLLDLNLPDSSGYDTVKIINEKIKFVPVIVLTGRDDEELALKSLKFGIQDYLIKGKIDQILLERSILYTIERYHFIEAFKRSEKTIREELNRINFYKDLFIHDINDIFQGIMSATQIYSMQLKNPETSNYIIDINEIIENQIKRGAKLISNVRKLSQLEETKINLKPVLIYNFILKSIKTLLETYKNQIINFQVISPHNNLSVLANDFLDEVFDNILINAVRHNENPIIEITIKISKEILNQLNYIKIEFIDNGIGIEDSRKESIFLRGTTKDTYKGGLGLGLSLVSKIIESYKGRIWMEDRIEGDYSQGSNFVILIPASGE